MESDLQRARQFLDQFGEAVQELVALHEQRFQAVVQGNPGAHRFDLLIHDANERKRKAKHRYMGHLDEHGCSLQNAIYSASDLSEPKTPSFGPERGCRCSGASDGSPTHPAMSLSAPATRFRQMAAHKK